MSHQFHVMTYNLQAHFAAWGGRPVKGRGQGVTELILELAPDILCIQEADRPWLHVLSKLPHYSSVETLRHGQLTHMTTLYYNTHTMKLIKSGSIAYKKGHFKINRRMCYGIFTIHKSKKTICVISTHLSLPRSGQKKSSQVMVHQAQQLKRTVDKLSHRYHCPVIIGGDFNSMEPPKKGQLRSNTPVKGVYPLLAKLFIDAKPQNHPRSLDHFFYNQDVVIDHYQELRGARLKALSDHYPVVIDCHLKHKEKKMTKAIVFDMDGVLFDSEQLYMRLWRELAGKYHIPHIDDILYRCLGMTVAHERKTYLQTYGADFPYDQYVEELKVDFFGYIDKYGMPLKTGTRELLDYLKNHDYKIALATSTAKDHVEMELKGVGLYDYFDVIVTGDMITHSKPAPDIYLKACHLLNVLPEKTYAVEDSSNGIRSAYNAHMKVIMVPDLLQPTDELKAMTTYIGASLLEVITYLDNL